MNTHTHTDAHAHTYAHTNTHTLMQEYAHEHVHIHTIIFYLNTIKNKLSVKRLWVQTVCFSFFNKTPAGA